MADHNPQHGRRPHFHRGRRGPERRGGERRTPPREQAPDAGARESTRENGVDVEQIMREIRSRIAQRHGVELSNQQIQELAARRLEAILEPRNVKPQLLEQLRKSAGAAPDIPTSAPLETYEFEDTTLYETHRGVLRFFRQLLNPILKLFFNPTPLVNALNTQARINKALAARELERERRQSEWNALHYELVQRMIVETSRVSLEMQALSSRIESLSAKVDFNERRVRGMETPSAPSSPRQPQRQPIQETIAVSAPVASEPAQGEGSPAAEGTGDGTRRRRRRRRGRRGGGSAAEQSGAPNAIAPGDEDLDAADGPEADEDDGVGAATEAVEPAAEPASAAPAVVIGEPEPPAPPVVAPTSAPEPAAPSAMPAPVPTPPRDEPTPEHPVDHADPGPVDR